MKEIRISKIETENRNDDTKNMVLVGRPILYDIPTQIGEGNFAFTEVIQRGALDGVDLKDTRLLYNHDMNKVPLAKTPKTMQLELDQAGLKMVANLANTEESRSVYTAVERGDLSGMSFAFKVPEGGDSYNAETRTRTIHKIEKIYEVSVVPFPAYATTSVEARSAIDNLYSEERDDLRIKLNNILYKGE
ncbi:HK97 family phage prohead protease [Facklamia sp. P9177]|uniref:HK97 family phage prohead protease n=1 Tax=Facklamia sp. P9177 TaxID=3421945 RepID=UPI003D18516C